MRNILLATLGLVMILASCGGQADSDPDEVRGIVVEVEGDLTSVEWFVLRTDDGETLRVVPAPDGDFRFPLPHLHDHLRTSEPLIVSLDRSSDPPVAIAIRDANNPEWHGGGTAPLEPEQLANPEEPVQEDSGSQPAHDHEHAHEHEHEEDAMATTVPPPPSDATTTSPSTVSTTTPATDETGKETSHTDETGKETSHTEDPEENSAPDQTDGPVIELVITDGKLEGGARREQVGLGDTVTLRVTGDSTDEVHVHGYDLFIHLVDGVGELTFEASIPGVFEVELEGPHTLLLRLEVS